MQAFTWLVLGESEYWCKLLVRATMSLGACMFEKPTKSTQRCNQVKMLVARVVDFVRQEFRACLRMARSEQTGRRADKLRGDRQKQPVLVVCIGSFKVRTLNTCRVTAFSVDYDSLAFIDDWLLPLIRCLLSAHSGPEYLKKFHLRCPCRDVPGKVLWNATDCCWKILILKRQEPPNDVAGASSSVFPVNAEVGGESFQDEKVAAFELAVAAWNREDSSKRRRVHIGGGQLMTPGVM